MQVTYSYPSGRRAVATVLAVGPDFIRVQNHGHTGGVNLHLRDQDWVSDKGTIVRVEAIHLCDGDHRVSTPVPKHIDAAYRGVMSAPRSTDSHLQA